MRTSNPQDRLYRQAIDAHGAELVRQRDALRSAWLWYIGPLLPGLALFLWGRQQELATPAAQAWHPWIHAITAVVLLAIALLNFRGSTQAAAADRCARPDF